MAIATTPYNPKINEWNLVYREEGNHETIVSNVAHLSAKQEGKVQLEAEASAGKQMEWPEALGTINQERQRYQQAYAETNGIEILLEKERAKEGRADDGNEGQEEERLPTIEEELKEDLAETEEFPKKDPNCLPPSRDAKRKRKEHLSGLTSHLIKVSNAHPALNNRLGIGRSMCNRVGKDTVTAGLGVFAREGFYKYEVICVVEVNSLSEVDNKLNNTYVGYINDPLDPALENTEIVFDQLLQKHVLRATIDIKAQHEVMMKPKVSIFTNELVSGRELIQKILVVEEKELNKAATKAALRMTQDLKRQMRPRSYHQKLDEKTKRETRALTIKELRHKELLRETGKTSPGIYSDSRRRRCRPRRRQP